MSYGNSSSVRYNHDDHGRNNNGRSYDRDRNNDRPRFQSAQRVESPVTPIVEEPKIRIDPKSRDMMCFKDNYYAVEMLRAQSGNGPLIEFSSDELHDNFITMVTPSRELAPEVEDFAPVFAKYEGKYVVLLGLKAVMALFSNVPEGGKAKLKGRLLSNPVLKRCLAT